jgi:hypothetical protein
MCKALIAILVVLAVAIGICLFLRYRKHHSESYDGKLGIACNAKTGSCPAGLCCQAGNVCGPCIKSFAAITSLVHGDFPSQPSSAERDWCPGASDVPAYSPPGNSQQVGTIFRADYQETTGCDFNGCTEAACSPPLALPIYGVCSCGDGSTKSAAQLLSSAGISTNTSGDIYGQVTQAALDDANNKCASMISCK